MVHIVYEIKLKNILKVSFSIHGITLIKFEIFVVLIAQPLLEVGSFDPQTLG